MAGSSRGIRFVTLVLFVVAFVLMVVATVIDFAKGGGTDAYLTLAASILLAIAVAVEYTLWSRTA